MRKERKTGGAFNQLICIFPNVLISSSYRRTAEWRIECIGGGRGCLSYFVFDDLFVGWFNGFARQSVFFDKFVMQLLFLDTVRLLPLIACFVLIWFSDTGKITRRWILSEALAGGALALLISRLIQNFGPSRPRPLYAEHLDFVLPFGAREGVLRDWSSFPSDTSALTFALVYGIYRASKPWGIVCFIWSFVIVCLPRIYAGYHYPSDIIAGALIGVAATAMVGWSSTAISLRERYYDGLRLPAGFGYAFLFVVLYQIATMFQDVRIASRGFADYLVAGG